MLIWYKIRYKVLDYSDIRIRKMVKTKRKMALIFWEGRRIFSAYGLTLTSIYKETCHENQAIISNLSGTVCRRSNDVFQYGPGAAKSS